MIRSCSPTTPALRATRDEVLAIAEGRSATQLLETQRDQTYAQRDRDIAGAVRLSGNLLLEDARGGRVADPATLERLVRDAGAVYDVYWREWDLDALPTVTKP